SSKDSIVLGFLVLFLSIFHPLSRQCRLPYRVDTVDCDRAGFWPAIILLTQSSTQSVVSTGSAITFDSGYARMEADPVGRPTICLFTYIFGGNL
ncbi:MAG: hypothetical protein LBH08_00910, partial [Puniceicoccales bacterium]|nr:hypothetical protein [Puniceicoccales bacterium]